MKALRSLAVDQSKTSENNKLPKIFGVEWNPMKIEDKITNNKWKIICARSAVGQSKKRGVIEFFNVKTEFPAKLQVL